MIYLINFIGFCKYMLILNLMPAVQIKQVGKGAIKGRECCGMLKNTCLEHSAGKQVCY